MIKLPETYRRFINSSILHMSILDWISRIAEGSGFSVPKRCYIQADILFPNAKYRLMITTMIKHQIY